MKRILSHDEVILEEIWVGEIVAFDVSLKSIFYLIRLTKVLVNVAILIYKRPHGKWFIIFITYAYIAVQKQKKKNYYFCERQKNNFFYPNLFLYKNKKKIIFLS